MSVIEEWRTVYENIRKFTSYVLASNVPEVVPYLGYGFLGMPLALSIPQVLAVDLGTDMIPALGLGTERPLADVMDVPPRPKTERLLNLPILLRTHLFLGAIEALITMGGFFLYLYTHGWTWGTNLDWTSPLYKEATTVTFSRIVLAQVANVFACRSDRLSITRLGWLTNPLILWGVFIELTILALITYAPIGNEIFGTSSLPLWIYAPLLLAALTLLAAEEIRKSLANRLSQSREPQTTQPVGG